MLRDCPANTGNPAFANPAFLNSLSGPNAIQLLLELGQLGNTQSEDCLTLNVWTKPQTGEKAKGGLQ
jgi:cholinesterase